MPCYHPRHGYRSKTKTDNGKRKIVFNPKLGYTDLKVTVACGSCIGCKLERSRQWAIRCVHEAQMHEKSCFITLTYAPEYLPKNGSLSKEPVPKFMKALRKKYGAGLKYYYCGEYGEKFRRPHYHLALFGMDFDDKIPWRKENGFMVYKSEELAKIWKKGFCTVGNVTFESAAYIARYITKKITGPWAEDWYTNVDAETGEIVQIQPEFTDMSRKSGIGKEWFLKYKSDVYPGDFVVIRGRKMKPPRYYDDQLEKLDPEMYKIVKKNRKENAEKHLDNNTEERLAVREEIQFKKFEKLYRSLENES